MSLTRREFLKALGWSIGASTGFTDLMRGVASVTARSYEPGVGWERAFDFVKDPLRIIDLVCEQIRLKEGLQSNTELSFLYNFSENSQNPEASKKREILKEGYRQIGEQLQSVLQVIAQSDSDTFFPMLDRLRSPWMRMLDLIDPAVGANDFMSWEIFNDLWALVEWLRPLRDFDSYQEQKRAYLPSERQADRITDSQFWSTYFPAMRQTRDQTHDYEWHRRYAMRSLEADAQIPPSDGIPEYNLRLVSQLDLKVCRASLGTIEYFFPFALVPLQTSYPGNLDSAQGVRAYHVYGREMTILGFENKYIADCMYAAQHHTGSSSDSSLSPILDSGMQVELHESTGHTYDPHNPNARNFSHLHPLDVIQYCKEYALFYLQMKRYLDLPTHSDMSLGSLDLDAVFIAEILPIFGLDEVNPFIEGNKERMQADFSLLGQASHFISAQHFSRDLFDQLGLLHYFDTSTSELLPIWKVLLDSDMGINLSLDTNVLTRLREASGFDLSGSAKNLFSDHIDGITTIVNYLMETAREEGQDKQYSADIGKDGLAGYERDLLLQQLLRIKSHYQFVFFIALHRLRELAYSGGFQNQQSFVWDHNAEGMYQMFHSMIELQLAHCLVGPFGEYVPTSSYITTMSLNDSPALLLLESRRRAESLFQERSAGYRKVTARGLPEIKQSALRDTIWSTQVRLQARRPILLGADISEAARYYRGRGMSWMNADDFLPMYPLVLSEFGDQLGIDTRPQNNTNLRG